MEAADQYWRRPPTPPLQLSAQLLLAESSTFFPLVKKWVFLNNIAKSTTDPGNGMEHFDFDFIIGAKLTSMFPHPTQKLIFFGKKKTKQNA